jgi:hypothetical protein
MPAAAAEAHSSAQRTLSAIAESRALNPRYSSGGISVPGGDTSNLWFNCRATTTLWRAHWYSSPEPIRTREDRFLSSRALTSANPETRRSRSADDKSRYFAEENRSRSGSSRCRMPPVPAGSARARNSRTKSTARRASGKPLPFPPLRSIP